MTGNEFEVLVALAKSAKHIRSEQQAGYLVEQLGAYLLELPTQKYVNTLSIRRVSPSPWQVATKRITMALLILAEKFPSMRDQVETLVLKYIARADSFVNATKMMGSVELLFPFLFSLQGYLEALTLQASFLGTNVTFGYSVLDKIYNLVTTDFLLKIEGFTSQLLNNVEDSEEDNNIRSSLLYSSFLRYFERGNRLGAMALNHYLTKLFQAVSRTFVVESPAASTHEKVIAKLFDDSIEKVVSPQAKNVLDVCNKFAQGLVQSLDEGSDYIELTSPENLELAFDMKAVSLEILSITVYFGIDKEAVVSIVESSLFQEHSMTNLSLSVAVYDLASLLCASGEPIVQLMTRHYPGYVSNPNISEEVAWSSAYSLTRAFSQDSSEVVISLIYTLVNSLAPDANGVSAENSPVKRTWMDTFNRNGNVNASELALDVNGSVKVYRNIVTALVSIAATFDVTDICVLASTVLVQKLNVISRELDHEVVLGLSKLAPSLPEREFQLILRSYKAIEVSAFRLNESRMVDTLKTARCNISRALGHNHPHFAPYLRELLSSIVGKGDVKEFEHHRSHTEISATGDEIATLIPPLAELLANHPEPPYAASDSEIYDLFRNSWFNMVVHGFSKNSPWIKRNFEYMRVIARSTPPLVSEVSANKTESELDLNTVLRRGSSNHNVKNQRSIIGGIFSTKNLEFRMLPYPKLMFLSAAVFLESIRADAGNCSRVALYFGDPSFRSGDSNKFMSNIATDVMKEYINNARQQSSDTFSIDNIAGQLRELLLLCCHRVQAVQDVAFNCADMLVKSIPASLCKRKSLYTLLDLLTLLWTSCLDAETDEYEPRTTFTSHKTNVKIELSDSYDHRRLTLQTLLEKASSWVRLAITIMNFDIKSLLTDYLADNREYKPLSHVSLGSTFALEMGGQISRRDGELATLATIGKTYTDSSSGFLSQYIWRTTFKVAQSTVTNEKESLDQEQIEKLRAELEETSSRNREDLHFEDIRNALFHVSRLLIQEREASQCIKNTVTLPFKLFTEKSIQLGISFWLWTMYEVPQLRAPLISQVVQEWERTVLCKEGLFSSHFDLTEPEFAKMEYAPSNKAEVEHYAALANRSMAPHLNLIRFLSSQFHASTYESRHLLRIFTRALIVGLEGLDTASKSPLARSIRFELIRFGIDVLNLHMRFGTKISHSLKDRILTAALSWFKQRAHWPYGGNRLKLRYDVSILADLLDSFTKIGFPAVPYNEVHNVSAKRDLLVLLMKDELAKMSAWLDPLQTGSGAKFNSPSVSGRDIEVAWEIDPELAVNLAVRKNNADANETLKKLVSSSPISVIGSPSALRFFMESNPSPEIKRFVLYWAVVSPIESINLFLPMNGAGPISLQFAMRSLEAHDVNLTFFYVPQIVQCLRYDNFGYVERYILETAKLSQLFAHQIIWNMLANSYKDDEGTDPNELKPTLDAVQEKMLASFNEEEMSFYKREFGFFNEVTAISGTLKPYIKKTKAEKKAKIDEEIDKIKVDVGVYLPSNPDGVLVDIDRRSGKPLQSHAKAPFMATFKIRREVHETTIADNESGDGDQASVESRTREVDVWQSAIFKVGDDCRQDVLALQIIAVFRSIFKFSGLDLYVFPYRVTATAAGRGVIDVLPNSISRDMLGREAVNGLYEYFTSKHGGEDSIEFQRARNNFVKSLAAYSVISYLIQFKDRHNGNIMYDSNGHILHIDFGFCFDIVPGGVKFEQSPFKLTMEMVQVMGGSTETQAYRWFEELSIKAFLACRPYSETIIEVVRPMLDSGLPCFKGELTIKRLRNRFALDKSEAEAASHFRSLIRKSYNSIYTWGYDEFQKMTNGIPVSETNDTLINEDVLTNSINKVRELVYTQDIYRINILMSVEKRKKNNCLYLPKTKQKKTTSNFPELVEKNLEGQSTPDFVLENLTDSNPILRKTS